MPSVLANLTGRFATESRRFVERLRGGVGASIRDAIGNGANEKSSRYNVRSDAALRDLMLSGRVYRHPIDGGALPDVLRVLGYVGEDASRYQIRAHFNPVPSIVSFYRNAFGGRFDGEISIADEVNERHVDPRCVKLVRQIWNWSNLDHRADEFTTLGANQGMVGIRIMRTDDPSPRVFLDFDDRRSIVQVDRDGRGNVVTVYLRYQAKVTNGAGAIVFVNAEEIIGKDGFSLRYNGTEQLTPDQQVNTLGICPYVVCEHDTFARHAYAGSEEPIHAINFAFSQLDESTIAHVWPYIFATSPAAKPRKIDVGRFKMIYSQTREGQPQPTFDPMVPQLDFTAVTAQLKARIDLVRESQPQLILNSLSLLSGISGETLQQVLKPAEAESLRARTRYEDAIRRAIQLAISVGIGTGVKGFDLGTGTGTADAAERAFDDGDGPEAFAFADRPALPPTVAQVQQQAVADNADQSAKFDLAAKAQKLGIARKGVLKHAGMTPEEIRSDTQDRGDEATDGVSETLRTERPE